MTLNSRSLNRILFAALLALSLWITAVEAVADTRPFGSPSLFDPGFVDDKMQPRPAGHFGVTWE